MFCSRNGTPMTMSNMRRAFQLLCKAAGVGSDWTTYGLRHYFVPLVSDQLDDPVKVADLAGHVDTRTTEGYRHAVRPSIPHAIKAWEQLLAQGSGVARPVGASCDDDVVSAVPQPDRVSLATVFAQVPGKWVAVDLDTNEPRVVADSPAEMVAEIRRSGIDNVAVVRAPEINEPQLLGLG